ncbi:MAG TPA: SGNH/GDSL hydrolase family protein [Vicinamibacteria bacterium]
MLAVVTPACGGGSTPGGPTETPIPTYSVTATVFYDEDADGQLDANEAARVPGVEVVIGTGAGRSAPGTGVAAVTGIREGALTAAVRPESLPAYFEAAPPLPVQVPGTAEVRIPLSLPIGSNKTNLYLGLGDSITFGDGSSDGRGYGLKLQDLLGPYFGRAEVVLRGRSGDTSAETAQVTRRTLRDHDPAYTLILLGTNDWQDQTCQGQGPAACFTIDALEKIVDEVQNWRSLPVLATIIPVNPALAPAGRNTWNDEMNVRIKALAQQERITLADLNAEMKAAASLSALFADDVHPNDAGYQVLAQGWFKAITRARSAAAASSPRFGFSFRP